MVEGKCKMMRPIGGYFELEHSPHLGFLHDAGVLLNTGRNALEFVLRSLPEVSHLWIPFYTCSAILEPVNKLKIPFSFYRIDEHFELRESLSLQAGDYLIYTNYFGIKDAYVGKLAEQYGYRLIVDNAQAWFAEPIPGVSAIYSPRKYIGVPDGGVAFSSFGIDIDQFEEDYSYDRCLHLLKRIDLGPEGGYKDYTLNESTLSNQPIRRMSLLTRHLLGASDSEHVKEIRLSNFDYLKKSLDDLNLLVFAEDSFQCPMVYPFLSRDYTLKEWLIANKIYVASYWPNVLKWDIPSSFEYRLAQDLVCLPVDQRYGESEMERIVELIKQK